MRFFNNRNKKGCEEKPEIKVEEVISISRLTSIEKFLSLNHYKWEWNMEDVKTLLSKCDKTWHYACLYRMAVSFYQTGRDPKGLISEIVLMLIRQELSKSFESFIRQESVPIRDIRKLHSQLEGTCIGEKREEWEKISIIRTRLEIKWRDIVQERLDSLIAKNESNLNEYKRLFFECRSIEIPLREKIAEQMNKISEQNS